MEKQKNDLDEQVRFSQLLKELAETQVVLAKVDAQLAIREGADQVKSVVQSAKQSLESKAKKFGANIKKIEEDYINGSGDKKGILEEYETSLEEANDTYHRLMQDILEKKAQLEADEQETMMWQKYNKIGIKNVQKDSGRQEEELKAEIVKATKEGRIDDAKQKIAELQEITENNPVNSLKALNEEFQTRREELRKQIEECEKEFEKVSEERKAAINELTESKNNKLSKIPKQNLFQKAMGAMFSRFNGTKKFMQTAIEPLKEKITQIKEEEIPRLKQEISGKRQKFSDKIQEARAGIEEKVQGKVEEYATKLAQTGQKAMETVNNMKNNVIGKVAELGQKAKNAKDNVVQGAKNVRDLVVNGAKEKAQTIASYGIEAKDVIANGKNAIIQGAKERRNAIMQGAIGTKDNVVQSLVNTRDNVIQTAVDTKDAVKTKISNAKNTVTTYVTNTVENGKRTFRDVIGKGLQMKISFINSVQSRLSEKQKEIAEKMQTLNPELTQKEAGIEIGG